MDCVNHPGVNATAYCQNCGKAMCAACARQEAGGQILCEPCWTAWQSVRAPFAPLPPGVPNPVVATVLGFIPGVGAMYNGQFVKGFIHVAIFAVLVSMADHFPIFGLFIAAWVLYQVFDAHQTAKARLNGDPLPDPLGLNELAGWFHTGIQAEIRRGHGVPQAGPGTPPPASSGAAQYTPPAGGEATGGHVPPAVGYAPPYSAPYQNPYQSGYRPPPVTGTPPAGGFTAGYPPPAGFAAGYPPIPPIPPVPPMPPAPPVYWRRREPVAAIILIAMGVLFLMGQMDWFSGRMFEFSWPALLIGLGVWLFIRRMHDVPPVTPMPPGAPGPTPTNAAGPPAGGAETGQESGKESRGGSL